ncbi:MAG: PAS domain S-box protein [Labilithrix sp.]|nr:PAS domain S-box protein [Labilithrix sp.]MCW5837707.1 PAS domain S-box protein [Labilithrix sp.]
MHKLLTRQLELLEIPADGGAPPTLDQWQALLALVGRTYAALDHDRYTLERSLSLSTMEVQRLDDALMRQKDKLRAVFESAAVGILTIDADGFIVDANRAATSMFGLSRGQITGQPLSSFFDEGVPVSLAPPSGPARAQLFEHVYTHPSGRSAWFYTSESWVMDSASTVPFGTVIIEDVTEKKHLEGSLRHAQKLEAVGRLAAGIAHEINTPIQFVNDNVHFLRESFSAVLSLVGRLEAEMAEHGEELHERYREAEADADWPYLGAEIPKSIAQTIDGLQRVATIVQSMKSFAHEDRGEQAPADLNAALASTLTVATHELKGIAVPVTKFGDIPPVVCFRGDLNQVFLNLVVNAAHSIADVVKQTGGLGRITLSTRRDGDEVVIAISDTGAGIPDDVAAKMFDPFFTTKEVGRGSGQGLALARAIVVKKHGGSIDFDTKLGVGTTFVIRLPIGGAAAPEARAA